MFPEYTLDSENLKKIPQEPAEENHSIVSRSQVPKKMEREITELIWSDVDFTIFPENQGFGNWSGIQQIL